MNNSIENKIRLDLALQDSFRDKIHLVEYTTFERDEYMIKLKDGRTMTSEEFSNFFKTK